MSFGKFTSTDLIMLDEESELIGYGDNDPFLKQRLTLGIKSEYDKLKKLFNGVKSLEYLRSLNEKSLLNKDNHRWCSVSCFNEDIQPFIDMAKTLTTVNDETKKSKMIKQFDMNFEKKKESFIKKIVSTMSSIVVQSLEVITEQISLIHVQKQILLRHKNRLFVGINKNDINPGKFATYIAIVESYSIFLDKIEAVKKVMSIYHNISKFGSNRALSSDVVNDLNKSLIVFSKEIGPNSKVTYTDKNKRSLVKLPLREHGWKQLTQVNHGIDVIVSLVESTKTLKDPLKTLNKQIEMELNSDNKIILRERMELLLSLSKFIVGSVLSLTIILDKLCKIITKTSGLKNGPNVK